MMKRELRITSDGSTTIFVPGLNEHYHSIHGAVAESKHIFIEAAFNYSEKQEVRILELGFGTGLNALLTCIEAQDQERRVYYHGVEKYPLSEEEALDLNYDTIPKPAGLSILDFHRNSWEVDHLITKEFTLHKQKSDIRNFNAHGLFDVIYFDAFAPNVQPSLWAQIVFDRVFQLTAPGGILTTYTVKGDVRRALLRAGFKVEKIPGPKGKREIIRALKSYN